MEINSIASIIKMRSPWQHGPEGAGGAGFHHGVGHQILIDSGGVTTMDHTQSRSSLGLLMERSTSAPPLSSSSAEQSASPAHDDLLVGNDLLEQMNRAYLENFSSQSTTPLTSNGVLDASHLHRIRSNGTYNVDVISGVDQESGLVSSVSSYAAVGLGLSRPLSAEAQVSRGPGISIDRNSRGDGGTSSDQSLLAELTPPSWNAIGPLDRIVRSRSAQPSISTGHSTLTLIGPPPGLQTERVGSSSHQGVGGSHYSIPPQVPFHAPAGIRRPASTGVLGTRQHEAVRPAAKTLMDLIQEDYPDDSHTLGGQNSFDDPSPPPSGMYPQPQDKFHPSFNIHQNPKITTHDEVFMMHSQIPQQQQQQQPQQQSYVFIGDTQTRQSTPPATGSVYAQLISPNNALMTQQAVLSTGSIPVPQQVFYNGHQRVQIQPSNLVQSGQNVYVNTPSTQSGYGYSSIPYHSVQQPQIIHQSMAGVSGSEGHYVSVVPMQAGGTQQIFWQPDMSSQHQSVGHTIALVNSSPGGIGSGPISMIHVGNLSTSAPPNDGQRQGSSPQANGNRSRDKSGRGRRGGGPQQPRNRATDTKSSAHIVASPLLEEFRLSKNRDWTVRQIEGHVVEFCQDQNGSRFIQQRLELGIVSEQEVVMSEVLPAIRRLRNDVFGNYVVQKLLDFGTPRIKAEIRKTLEGEMMQLSQQMYGCRVVQKALESLDEDDLPRILLEFHHNVLSLVHDQNGNHVIQKCVEVMNHKANKAETAGDPDRTIFLREQIDFIINDVLVNIVSLSCHPYGCRVLQRILEHCDDTTKNGVLDEIQKCHQRLLDDQYGNYVIQHVLQFGRASDRDSILQLILQNGLLGLSRQKFASNVVEKLLKYGNSPQRRAVVREMLKIVDDSSPVVEPGDLGKSIVLLMVRDAYANYVVQTTLDVVPESDERRLLLKELNAHSDELRNYTFAKHIVTKLTALNNQ